MKKILILGLVAVMLSGQISFASFSDVTVDTDYQTAISWMNSNGVIQGYPDGTFGPDNCVNRVEMLKLLFEMLEVDASNASAELFSDTYAGEWYVPYLKAGRERGTVEGYPDGTFKPAQCVNRVEAIKMAVLEFNNGVIPDIMSGATEPLDLGEGEWYYDYLYYGIKAGVLGLEHRVNVEGGTNYLPGESMSRKEVAEMLYSMKAIQDYDNDIYIDGMTPAPIVDDITFSTIIKLDNNAFMADYKDDLVASYNDAYGTAHTWLDLNEFFGWYQVGTIKKAPYNGYKLLVLNLQCDGMCMNPYIHRFAYNETTKDLVHLELYSYMDYVPEYVAPLTVKKDNYTSFTSLTEPQILLVPGTWNYVSFVAKDYAYQPENLTTVIFTDSVYGPVYTYATNSVAGCVYLKHKDGSVSIYSYDSRLFKNYPVNIDFTDGSEVVTVNDNYVLSSGGCGLGANCYILTDVETSDLVKAATANGVALYEVANPLEGAAELTTANNAQKALDQRYQSYVSWFEAVNEGETALTWAEYLDLHPILYWKDPFNRWSSISNNQFTPPAECGKPVIYLYPETTTDVHVEVGIPELTVTIPDYGANGWTVKAEPDGTLYNYADGKTYPYLFWEGKKDSILGTDQGFVIERNELNAFFDSSLEKMGLNEKEAADFKDFWVSRMLDNSEKYFFISFIGTNDFNKIAPLEITPEPDTLIRVFMYYTPLNSKLVVREQQLSSIPRNGFTVIEWGGTSDRPWKR